ncbi:Esterase/lipase [Salinimicrobium catena]|uniref:Esterase/lipase n=1 Tax=Salinimicrobium catena TaxID=390640 RepID=A0A1H5MWZ5_9FLAO|nr:alpha/beta hydrolase [Salinimicrobium catena]SDL31539.1 Esterase/lipase [Salinimicrobium catena]SEE93806.1 Esterase/lipase [Salinimicrobium catena]
MKKRYWFILLFFAIIVVTYFSGPHIPKPEYDTDLPRLPEDLIALEEYVERREAKKPVRKDNHARILWQDSVPRKTEYSVVYLHGFAGSYRDGYPVNVHIADTLDANLYMARWAGHGLKPKASLKDFSAEAAWKSAKEALQIGKQIGEKVIIMSTSTGGTLALKLAATYPDKVHALINLSPNIEDDVEGAFLLNSPWGYELAHLVALGSNRKISHEEELAAQYWDTVYPSRALVDLQVLVSTAMSEQTFSKVRCPVLTLYYYENFMEEDEHIEVDDLFEMHYELGTRKEEKRLVSLEEPKTHFLGSEIKSSNTEVVEEEILKFLKTVLEIKL